MERKKANENKMITVVVMLIIIAIPVIAIPVVYIERETESDTDTEAESDHQLSLSLSLLPSPLFVCLSKARKLIAQKMKRKGKVDEIFDVDWLILCVGCSSLPLQPCHSVMYALIAHIKKKMTLYEKNVFTLKCRHFAALDIYFILAADNKAHVFA